jgi:predicted RNase H-like nuclease (RuvC/YqgF family)
VSNDNSAKPREFWIWHRDFDFDLGFERGMIAQYPHKDTLGGALHVIEYSAYEALQKRVAELEKENEKLMNNIGDANQKIETELVIAYQRIAELESKLAAQQAAAQGLAEALDVLLADTQHSDHNCGDELCPVDEARRVLTKFNEAKKKAGL